MVNYCQQTLKAGSIPARKINRCNYCSAAGFMSLNKADNSYKAGKENLRLEFCSSLMENHLPRTLVQVLKNRLVESISWRGASSRKGAISVETQWSGQMFYGVSLCRDKCCINYDDSSSTKGGVIVIKYINSTIYRSCAEWDVLKRYVCSNACHVVPFTNKTYILAKSKDKDFSKDKYFKKYFKSKSVCDHEFTNSLLSCNMGT